MSNQPAPRILKIKIIKQTTLPESVGEDRIGRPDDVVEIGTNDANYLIGVKHAVLADKSEKLVRHGKPAPAKAPKVKADA